jgi:hypothetical protein
MQYKNVQGLIFDIFCELRLTFKIDSPNKLIFWPVMTVWHPNWQFLLLPNDFQSRFVKVSMDSLYKD